MADDPRLDPEMLRHYEFGLESTRLERYFRLEYVRTRELLARYLPPAPARILDVGGAAGAYALPLAAEGHEVQLVDPVELHVRQALEASEAQPEAPLAGATVGDARDLSFPETSADAVLLLGPLYHLTDRDDRIAALREARRVLRPGGRILAAAISAFASTYDGLFRGLLAEPGFEEIVERDVREGQHRNPIGRPDWFTTAFFHRPDELRSEVESAGLDLEALVAVEGPGSFLIDIEPWLDDPDRRELLLRAISRVESEPSILGASAHLLAVAGRA